MCCLVSCCFACSQSVLFGIQFGTSPPAIKGINASKRALLALPTPQVSCIQLHCSIVQSSILFAFSSSSEHDAYSPEVVSSNSRLSDSLRKILYHGPTDKASGLRIRSGTRGSVRAKCSDPDSDITMCLDASISSSWSVSTAGIEPATHALGNFSHSVWIIDERYIRRAQYRLQTRSGWTVWKSRVPVIMSPTSAYGGTAT